MNRSSCRFRPRRRRLRVLAAMASLLVGVGLYLLFRTEHLVVYAWLEALGLRAEVLELRALVADWRPRLPEWVRFNLPHALWYYSLLEMTTLCWQNGRDSRRVILLSCAAVVALEGAEFFWPASGTFDWLDLSGILVVTLFMFVLEQIRRKDHHAPHPIE